MFRRSAAALLIASALAALPGCGGSPEVQGQVGDFSLTDQDGQTVTRDDLLGKFWVASFIFTRCSTGCPQVLGGGLTQLQQDLHPADDVLLVSFTVDPDHDRPPVLKEHAEAYGADPRRWRWLTGDRDAVYRLIRESFLLAVEETQGEARTPGNEVTHSTRLVLVDRQGRIRGYFEGRQADEAGRPVNEVPKLERALRAVRREGRLLLPEELPGFNATLNGTGAAVLLAGYGFIRRGRIRPHAACMLTALVVSAAFLASYLYYHLAVRHGQPTRFTGTGWVRPVYFAVLLSHTALAAVVPFLAFFTAYLALRGRLARHVRVARWTLPLWLYVSVTGVVVYWMLYRLYPPG
jgi:protein SCO1/2/putative membrane protein